MPPTHHRDEIPHVSPIARCVVPNLMVFGDLAKLPLNAHHIGDQFRYLTVSMDAVAPGNQFDLLHLAVEDWGSAFGFH